MKARSVGAFLTRNARLFFFVIAIVGMLVVGWRLDAPRHLHAALTWVDELGFWGPAVYVALYIAVCVFMIPGSGRRSERPRAPSGRSTSSGCSRRFSRPFASRSSRVAL